MNAGGHLFGGEGGIRTHEGRLTLTPLAGERLQPLGHLSARLESAGTLGFLDRGRKPQNAVQRRTAHEHAAQVAHFRHRSVSVLFTDAPLARFARDAVFAEFRPRHARAIDQGDFADRKPGS